MKEEQSPAGTCQAIPQEISTSDMVEFMAEDVRQFLPVQGHAEIREKNHWRPPADRCRRGDARQDTKPASCKSELLRERIEEVGEFAWRGICETQNPPKTVPIPKHTDKQKAASQ
jgi:hypothetical protein